MLSSFFESFLPTVYADEEPSGQGDAVDSLSGSDTQNAKQEKEQELADKADGAKATTTTESSEDADEEEEEEEEEVEDVCFYISLYSALGLVSETAPYEVYWKLRLKARGGTKCG